MKRARGFSLLEVLVAFTILALSLGVLMQIFSGSLRNADITRDAAQATALAQTLLAGAGVETPLTTAESGGVHAGKFRWRLVMAPHDEPRGDRPLLGVPESPRGPTAAELWRVTAEVAWGGDEWAGGRTGARNVTLTTLRLRKPSPP